MPRLLVVALTGLTIAIPVAAFGQAGAPDSENGRYAFNRVEDGYLRLDQRTGQVSLCAKRPMGWSCHPVPDERSALEEEIARLQKDNAALKKELLARGITPPGGGTAKAPEPDKPTLKLPSDAELDRAVAVMERLWKRLVEMVQRWQREMTPI
ncbi:hypothetical protein [Pseudorhodoplanes sp.]|jgi:hypothetical protein|uniref:hypothetical protein n=1 Tax=Pseudorhodoplanes sp. TaxID=1934341 RepID=UPI002B72327D|nr:hypothetical protein [Pseudorhodoplanes sp.]HWV42222.1 hypothetical protein [Pseudorhodoplanes sp.]